MADDSGGTPSNPFADAKTGAESELLAAAGHASGSANFYGKITRYGATWKDAAPPELVGHA